MAVSQTETEMEMAIEEFLRYDDSKARQVTERNKVWSSISIYLIGKGSSFKVPATHAKNRAKMLLPHERIEVEMADLAAIYPIRWNSFVFLCSNSGTTTEILELAKQLRKKKTTFFGITAGTKSPLAKMCRESVYFLQQPKEKATAATKSVIEQAFFYDAFIHYLSHSEFELANGKGLREIIAGQMQANLHADISQSILERMLYARNIYWIDKNTGLCDELALKTKEITGKPSQYLPGTEILHGHAAAIKKDEETEKADVIIVGSMYSQKDVDALKAVAAKTGAYIFSLEKQKGFISLEAQATAGYEVYSLLPAGWNLLLSVCKAMEKNPDNTPYIQKSRVI